MSTIGKCDLKDTADSKKKRCKKKTPTKEISPTDIDKKPVSLEDYEAESVGDNSQYIDNNIQMMSVLEI